MKVTVTDHDTIKAWIQHYLDWEHSGYTIGDLLDDRSVDVTHRTCGATEIVYIDGFKTLMDLAEHIAKQPCSECLTRQDEINSMWAW